MEHKEFVQEWERRIKAGLDYREKYANSSIWKEYRNAYRGDHPPEVLAVNKVFSYGRMLMPRVYFRAPRVSVTALRPELVPHARVVEAIDNMLIREAFLKDTIKKAVLDAYLCGTGCIKLGYDSEFGYIPEQAIDDSGETVTQVARKGGRRIEYHVGIKPGMPWALRVRPEDVVVPWGATDPDSLPWVAHYILRPLEDVKQDQKYRNTDKLKGTRTPDLKNIGIDLRPHEWKDKDVVYAELWEIRDYSTGQVYVICEDQLLLADDDALQIEGLPWEFLVFNPDPEYFWGIPDVKILAPLQKELNEVRTQISRHRAIALLKFLYLRNAIKPEELNKLFSGEVGPGVAIDNTESVASVITTLQPHIPPDLYRELIAIENNMRESLGFSINQLGEFSPYHGKTASETMVVAEAFEQRVDERRDMVADLLVRIVRKWNQMIFKFWNEERVIRIVSETNEPVWVKYTGDEIAGEYHLAVDADSGMPLTRGLKIQVLQEVFKALGGDPLIDQVALRRIMLEQLSMVDPRLPFLITAPQSTPEQLAAQARQPTPAFGGMGRPGRKGATPETPLEFEEFRRRFAR